MQMADTVKLIAAAIGGFLTWLFGGWLMFIGVVLALVVLDYITGMLAAKVTGTLSSKVGYKGIPKKLLIITMVVAAAFLDIAIRVYVNPSLAVCLGIACSFYAVNEGLSILENLGRAGVPYPDKLRDVILVLNKKDQPPSVIMAATQPTEPEDTQAGQ